MSSTGPHATACPNCDTALTPAMHYCSYCGQENHNLNVPIGHLIYEVVEGILHFDSKFFNTVRVLLTRPGLITRDFVSGRRARYVPPVRLYLFVSFVFFLLLTMFSDKSLLSAEQYSERVRARQTAKRQALVSSYAKLGIVPDSVLPTQWVELSNQNHKALQERLRTYRAGASQRRQAGPTPVLHVYAQQQYAALAREEQRRDSFLLHDRLAVGLNYTGSPKQKAELPLTLVLPRQVFLNSLGASNAQLDSTLRANKAPTGWYYRTLLRQTARILARGNQVTTLEQFRELVHRLVKNASLMMFLLMPVVALLLQLLYRRQRRYYFEHFIFSVHLHTVLFLLLSVALLIWLRTGFGALGFLMALAVLAIYFFLALRRVYQQSWLRTSGRFVVFLLGYLSCMSLLLFLTGAYSFLTY